MAIRDGAQHLRLMVPLLLNVLPSQLYDEDMIVYDMLNHFSMFQLLTDHLSPPYVQSKRKDHGNGSRHEVC